MLAKYLGMRYGRHHSHTSWPPEQVVSSLRDRMLRQLKLSTAEPQFHVVRRSIHCGQTAYARCLGCAEHDAQFVRHAVGTEYKLCAARTEQIGWGQEVSNLSGEYSRYTIGLWPRHVQL